LKNISFDELSKYFHLPINQVAKELGVCATILKKICRRNGIPRWPHRKIKSLDKMIANLEINLTKNPSEREEIIHEIELLKAKKLEIMKNPDILVSKNANRGHIRQLPMKNTKGIIRKPTKFKEPEDEDDYSSEDDANCWEPISTPEKSKENFKVVVDAPLPPHIVASRRPSLPILENVLASSTINLPPPIRRRSIDIITPKITSSFSRSAPHAYHPQPSFDYSQKLAAFNFHETTSTVSLPCIEPMMEALPSQHHGSQEESNTFFPDWFIAEKSRVLGNL